MNAFVRRVWKQEVWTSCSKIMVGGGGGEVRCGETSFSRWERAVWNRRTTRGAAKSTFQVRRESSSVERNDADAVPDAMVLGSQRPFSIRAS
jgi:hypothetical protein